MLEAKIIKCWHILSQILSSDKVSGQFKTPLHLSAPKNLYTRQPWAILITCGRSGPYSMDLHTARSSKPCSKQSPGSSSSVTMEWIKPGSPILLMAQLWGTLSIIFAMLILVSAREEALGRLEWIWGLLDKLSMEIPLVTWADSGSWAVFSNYPDYSLVWFLKSDL